MSPKQAVFDRKAIEELAPVGAVTLMDLKMKLGVSGFNVDHFHCVVMVFGDQDTIKVLPNARVLFAVGQLRYALSVMRHLDNLSSDARGKWSDEKRVRRDACRPKLTEFFSIEAHERHS
jgi:hypothetical protein